MSLGSVHWAEWWTFLGTWGACGVFSTTGVSEAGQGSQGCKGEDLRTGEVVWTAWLTFEQAWAHSCPSYPSHPVQVVLHWVLLVLKEASFTPGVAGTGWGPEPLWGTFLGNLFGRAWKIGLSLTYRPTQVVFPRVLFVLIGASLTTGVAEAGQGAQSLQRGGLEDKRSGMDSLAHV